MGGQGSNRIAIITGASRGLGATVARFLGRQEWGLILTARGEKALKALADEVVTCTECVIPMAGNVADPDHRARLVEQARKLGGLDVLINNASTLGPTPLPALSDASLADLEETLHVNTVAPLALVQEALPLLEARHGLVVNVSSDAALGGYQGWGVYGASKAALDLISLTLANELRARHVSVVSVDPGDMQTKMQQDAFPGEDISDRPMPEVTLPFWAWLIGQDWAAISGGRYEAQGDSWEVPA
jgi:NAD(P)-dependent dehydrogenase (short-subunit alcohol dehydrogenase family)